MLWKRVRLFDNVSDVLHEAGRNILSWHKNRSIPRSSVLGSSCNLLLMHSVCVFVCVCVCVRACACVCAWGRERTPFWVANTMVSTLRTCVLLISCATLSHCYGLCQLSVCWLNIVFSFGDLLLCSKGQFVNTILPWLQNKCFQLMLVRLQTVLTSAWVYLWVFDSQIHFSREIFVTIHFVEEVKERNLSGLKHRTYSSEIRRKIFPVI
jgi:hypothetical protein